MSACSIAKERMLDLKYYVLRYSNEEIFARKILSNRDADSVRDIGFLISASFMDTRTMKIALKVAFERLAAQETFLFSKHKQYYKSLIFIQKVCMESLLAKRETLKNHRRILSFIFYSKELCNLETNIRIASIAILKQINQDTISASLSNNTFFTCVSHTCKEEDMLSLIEQTQEE